MPKRIFISFAADDSRYRDMLKGQARNERSPFEFVDMSVKEPWDTDWKKRCLTKIKGCDGMIVMVSKLTFAASGARFEMECAINEGIPLRGVYISYAEKDSISIPAELENKRIVQWTWPNIESFINSL